MDNTEGSLLLNRLGDGSGGSKRFAYAWGSANTWLQGSVMPTAKGSPCMGSLYKGSPEPATPSSSSSRLVQGWVSSWCHATSDSRRYNGRVSGFLNRLQHMIVQTQMKPYPQDLSLFIPQIWPVRTSDLLYFHVEDVKSYAWTPRTPKSVHERVSYHDLKIGISRERVRDLN
ncbi:hypothetical protein E3N88_38631 [Mikania micrantha]|uniref:Uncharacterized protein n=1 Tax=Mikania micrantha TaxID=192012 RepID=A0A5N6LUJ0_9ASTR|nr:hypothetical protein E3N88_38631 [Mikania micrantha]